MSDKRQKNQLVLAFMEESRSEAPRASVEGTESRTAKRRTESPVIGEQLMEEVCERENCKQALARVKANKGSPGVDGITVVTWLLKSCPRRSSAIPNAWPAFNRKRKCLGRQRLQHSLVA